MSKWYWRDGSIATLGMDEDPNWREHMKAVEEKLTDPAYKILRQETLPNGKWISTVWLGLDHSFDRGGLPLIFETMVFESDSDMGGLDQRRYSSEAEAMLGHEELKREWSHDKTKA